MLQRLVWNGWVPIQVTIEEPEVARSEMYLLKGRRGSYLSLHLGDILAYFRRYLVNPEVATDFDWWFEHNGIPLNWTWPIGLLHDFYVHAAQAGDEVVPWQITLRHGSYPKELITLHDYSETIHEYWLNQFKEAAYLRDGNSNAVMSLSRDDSTKLWTAMQSGTFATFWRIYRPLTAATPRHIPLRLYRTDTYQTIQRLVPFVEGETLGVVLRAAVPELFPSARASVLGKPILHGVMVPLGTPIAKLWAAAYPDGFLHVIIETPGTTVREQVASIKIEPSPVETTVK